MSRFVFVGKIVKPKETEKFIKVGKNDFKSLNFMIKSDDNMNTAFVSLPRLGIRPGETHISVFDKDRTSKKKLEIPFNDRFNQKTLDVVSGMSKYRTNIGTDGKVKEFLTQQDLFDYLLPILENESDLRVEASGRIRISEYKGNFYYNFEIKDIFTNDTKKSDFILDMELFYGKDSLDMTDKSQKIVINAYIEEYFSTLKEKRFIPVILEFNTSKLDLSKEQHKNIYNDNVSDFTVKDNSIMKMKWNLKYIRGAEKVAKSYEDLSTAQQREIKNGRATLEDYSGDVLGESKQVIRIFKPVLIGDFENGKIDSGFTYNEFMEKVYTPLVETQVKKPTIDEALKNTNVDDVDDIFGDDNLDDLIG